MTTPEIRPPLESETDALAALWHRGWHDAHAAIVPPEVVALRTQDRFLVRVRDLFGRIRTAGPFGAPFGLCIVAGDEVDQIYVVESARGSGLALRLMDDAERIIAQNGFATAWLACAVGNERAARFYEKCGWTNVETRAIAPKAVKSAAQIEIWRFEKNLSA